MLRHRHRAPRWLQSLIRFRIKRKLKLDTQQLHQLDELQQRFHQTHDEIRQLRQDAATQVQQLLQQEQVAPEAVERLLAIPGKYFAERRSELAQTISRFLDGLRPEQRQRLTDALQHHWHHHHA